MSILLHGVNPLFVSAMQELRMVGKESVQILTAMKLRGLSGFELASNFVQAFQFVGYREWKIVRSWSEGGADDMVNYLLEVGFARRRLNDGDLELSQVAAYLGVEQSILHEFVKRPENKARLLPSERVDNQGQTHSAIILPPKMLYELEALYPSVEKPWPPWWEWRFGEAVFQDSI